MTINTHTDDRDLDGSELITCPSQSATAIAPVPDVANQALVTQSDHTMGITTTFEEAVTLDRGRLPGQLTPVALILPDGLPHEEWLATIEALKGIKHSLAWWWGDVLNFGERKYGEMYEQALAATGLSYHHLNHAKQVASRFEFSRRRLNLSWAHHQEVAPISDDAAQDELLDEAEKSAWSQKALRTVIRARCPKSSTPKAEDKLPQRRQPVKGAPEADKDRVAALPAQGPALAIDAALDPSSAPLVEEPAPEEHGDGPIEAQRTCNSAATELADDKTPAKDAGDISSVADSADPEPEQGSVDRNSHADVTAREEPSGTTHHDNAGPAEPSQDLARPASLAIDPRYDPYSEVDPLWVRGALPALGILAPAVARLPEIPNRDAITRGLLELFPALAPACLECNFSEEGRGKILSLLSEWCGCKDLADQLSRRWLELDGAQSRDSGGDARTMSPGGREEEPTNEISTRSRNARDTGHDGT